MGVGRIVATIVEHEGVAGLETEERSDALGISLEEVEHQLLPPRELLGDVAEEVLHLLRHELGLVRPALYVKAYEVGEGGEDGVGLAKGYDADVAVRFFEAAHLAAQLVAVLLIEGVEVGFPIAGEVEAGRDGFKLLVLAIPPCSVTPWWKRDQREIVDKGQLLRLQRIAARHDFPLLDLAPAFAKRGNPKDAEWPHDSHWSKTGHRWTAEAIAEFIAAHEDSLFGAHP